MVQPLAPFDDEVVDAVATAEGRDPEALADLLRRQQRLVRDFPDLTVEALVHDWRKTFTGDPLVETDEVAFYLSVREHVWRDLADRMELSEEEEAALRALNERQFVAALGREADRVAVVLTK